MVAISDLTTERTSTPILKRKEKKREKEKESAESRKMDVKLCLNNYAHFEFVSCFSFCRSLYSFVASPTLCSN